MRRQKMGRKSSRKAFRRGAKKVNAKNRMQSYFMRGGIRL